MPGSMGYGGKGGREKSGGAGNKSIGRVEKARGGHKGPSARGKTTRHGNTKKPTKKAGGY